MDPQGSTVEQVIARIASRQHGIVTWAQMRRAGISAEEIKRRVRNGALIRVYRGVYQVGHRAPSVEARYMAAVLACGDAAVLSGRPGAHLYRLIKGPPPPPEVTAPTYRRVQGLRTRRSRLHRRDWTTYRDIPVMTIPRLLVDLAPDLALDDLARACHEAGVLHGIKPRDVETVLTRRPNAPGVGKLRMVMHGDAPAILSELERGFRKLLQDAGLPLPVMNRLAGAHRVDCRWSEPPLTVELDSYRFHNSRYSWKQDRLREREARRRGEWRRYIWEDVFEDGAQTVRELRALLTSAP